MEKFKKFEWTDDLSVGVSEMDREHETLILYINKLIDTLNKESPVTIILQNFDLLREYVILHFKHEEKLMDKYEFAGAEVHKKIHAQLISGLNEHRDSIEKDSCDVPKLVSFLRMWLTAHIKQIDTKYSEVVSPYTEKSA